MSHSATEATTGERNHIPYTVLVIAQKQVAEVEHYLLVNNPISVEATLSLCLRIPNALAPDTLNLCTQTEARSKPLTYSYRSACIRTELLERTCCKILTMFLT